MASDSSAVLKTDFLEQRSLSAAKRKNAKQTCRWLAFFCFFHAFPRPAQGSAAGLTNMPPVPGVPPPGGPQGSARAASGPPKVGPSSLGAPKRRLLLRFGIDAGRRAGTTGSLPWNTLGCRSHGRPKVIPLQAARRNNSARRPWESTATRCSHTKSEAEELGRRVGDSL